MRNTRNVSFEQICEAVKASLTDDLRLRQYRDKPVPAGCCYVASEAIFHLNRLVGTHHKLVPYQMMWEGVSHWFLHNTDTGEVADMTVEQFEKTPMYLFGKKRSFLTATPSKRAEIVIVRATAILEQSRLPVDK